MLPGDRAPAYPTQYAGEPTFLCRDLNIEETGEQKLKSNSGRPDCCYEYCGTHPRTGRAAAPVGDVSEHNKRNNPVITIGPLPDGAAAAATTAGLNNREYSNNLNTNAEDRPRVNAAAIVNGGHDNDGGGSCGIGIFLSAIAGGLVNAY
ncbi:hypothetical protein quinque_002890 [Culex quinquefasciatus]